MHYVHMRGGCYETTESNEDEEILNDKNGMKQKWKQK